MTDGYRSQAARDAQSMNYGTPSYWAYLDEAAEQQAAYYTTKGDPDRAAEMFTRSLSEALHGNNGS